MRYLALIYVEEPDPVTMPPGAWEEMMAKYDAFGQAATEAGVIRGGEALQSSDTATTIRVRDGHRLTTDGPFAETREQLGGFYVLDCADLDEAIAWASRIPGASIGTVELRPIIEIVRGG
jgi:hypothetical protein